MLVTDKQFYLDEQLKKDIDWLIERSEKDWDNLLIIDGREGSGKTVFSWGMAYYISWCIGKKFTHENIYFSTDSLMEAIINKKNEVIIYDEAALEALAMDSGKKNQKKLARALMLARKNNHFLIFIIPQIHRLNPYIAYDRAIGLVHIHSIDRISRGDFYVFNEEQKNDLLMGWYNQRKLNYSRYGYKGRYPKKYKYLIDEEAYEEKKDKALQSLLTDDSAKDNPYKKKLKILQYKISLLSKKFKGITQKELALFLDVNPKTIQIWSNMDK